MVKLTNGNLNPTFRLIPDESFKSTADRFVPTGTPRGNFQISPTTGIIKMQNSPNGTFYYSVCLKVAPDVKRALSAYCGKLIILVKKPIQYPQLFSAQTETVQGRLKI